MKKMIKIIVCIVGVIVILVWLLSLFFTAVTFSPEFEIHEDEHLVYQNVQVFDCNAINHQSKDLKIKFSYKYPLVNFNGKLEVIDKKDTINNSQGKILFSGKYKDKIILKNLCYSDEDLTSFYKKLEFIFSDKDAIYWFYSNKGKQGYPFLKYDEIEIKIDWFSIHPSKPYHITPIQ